MRLSGSSDPDVRPLMSMPCSANQAWASAVISLRFSLYTGSFSSNWASEPAAMARKRRTTTTNKTSTTASVAQGGSPLRRSQCMNGLMPMTRNKARRIGLSISAA